MRERVSAGAVSGRERLRDASRDFVIATLVFALTGAAALALLRLSEGTVALWISNALIAGYALRRPARALAPLLAAAFAGTLLSGGLPVARWDAVLVSAVANVAEVAVVALLCRRLGLRPNGRPDDRRLLPCLLVAVLAAPLLGALIGSLLHGPGRPWGELLQRWFFADAFGMFVVLPLAWSWSRGAVRQLVHGRALLEFGAVLAGAVVIAGLAAAALPHPYALLALPLLMVAVRGGVLATAIANAAVIATVLAIVALQRQGVLGLPDGVGDGMLDRAWFQACISAVGPLLVAVLSAERDRERRESMQVAERLQVIADNLPAYVAELGPDLRYRFVNRAYFTWLGKDPRALIGRTPADALGEAAAARLRPYMQRALAGEAQHFEFDMAGRRLDVSYEPLAHSGGFVLMAHDVTWRYEAERRFRHLLESAPDAMLLLDPATRRILLANHQAELAFGRPREALLATSIDRIIEGFDAIDDAAVRAHVEARASRGEVLELTGLRADGTRFPAEVVLSELHAGASVQWVAAVRDVTARRMTEQALQAERERAQVTLNSIGDAVITCDTARRVTSMNPVAEAMTGVGRARGIGQAFADVVRLAHVDAGDDASSGAALLSRADGEELHVEFAHSPITDGAGRVVGGVTVLRDVSEMRAMAQRMSHLAQHDYLTGLPNRVLLQDRLSQALQQGARGAVLYLDLDFFKTINDSLGHQAGDRVLQEIARRLCDAVRADDTVSRQGGDEFVLLLSRLSDPSDAARVAEALIRVVEAPLDVEGHALHVSASIGIALYPDDGDDIRTLTKHADTALYHAKHAGRSRYCYFTAAMSERADRRLRLESDLRAAVATGRLFLLYQPKMQLPERTLSGMEALVRWRHPDGHVVPPSEFIPVAEETGLVLAIDDWVLREACRQNRAWIDAGLPALPMAVNLSLARFDPERIVARLAAALRESGLPASLLEVELTESQMLGHSERASQLIEGIRELGVRVSVDDFGTGYSSLGYLTRHRFDAIKIDRSFVQGLPGARGQRAVVQAILGMARALDYHVVGEGVETDEQAAALLGLGCREMQGYLLGHPLDAAAMEALLRAQVR